MIGSLVNIILTFGIGLCLLALFVLPFAPQNICIKEFHNPNRTMPNLSYLSLPQFSCLELVFSPLFIPTSLTYD